MRMMKISGRLLLLAVLTSACSQNVPQQTAEEAEPKAPETVSIERVRVTLMPTADNIGGGILGFAAIDDGVQIGGTISGLSEGAHGFHIHEVGDCSNPSITARGHFNPDGKQHSSPDAPTHHAGDLGNIEADVLGSATVNIRVSGISLEKGAPNSVLGRSVMVHASADNFKTQPTGNAGRPVACGVISVEQPS